MNNRRRLLVALAGTCSAAVPFRALSQQKLTRIARIGFLSSESAADGSERARVRSLAEGLKGLGYIEGKNVLVEYRSAEGRYNELPRLAGELVQSKPDVIVASGIKAALAAKAATTTIPIVLPGTSSDVVGLGLAASLRRPGGNVTGSAVFGAEMMAKRLEILKQAVRRIARVGILWNTANAGYESVMQSIKAAAQQLHVEVEFFDVRDASRLEAVIDSIVKARMDAVATVPDTLFTQNAKFIADYLIRKSLPSVGINWFGESGGLIGYGPDENAMYRRAAVYVDKILNGTRAGELPFEQPMTFELVVNLRTAKALGLTMPPEIMVQTTQVIQ